MINIVELVKELAEPAAKNQGCFIWDVEFVKEAGEKYLRIYIDNDEGKISIDQCEAVSREVEAKLDELDPIQEAYIFEVSSAGAERELKRPSDFERFMGSTVAVKLYGSKNGRKEFVGRLTKHSEDGIELDGKTQFKNSEVAQVRLRVTF
jgi:ribosome maturation factor RimP